MKTLSSGSKGLAGPDVISKSMLRTLLLVCGILASLVWLGTDITAALRYEGYNYPFQPISGLSAVDAPTRSFVVWSLGLYIVLKIAFAWGVWTSAGRKRVLRITAVLLFAWGLVDLATSLFPWNPAESLWTPINLMHAIFAGGTVFLILLIIGIGARADGRWFRILSYGTLLVFLLSGILMSSGVPLTDITVVPAWFGITERINAYGYMLWMIVFSSVLLWGQPESV